MPPRGPNPRRGQTCLRDTGSRNEDAPSAELAIKCALETCETQREQPMREGPGRKLEVSPRTALGLRII